ncbi:MAG: T9SS type A sorting domain-containing protein [Saprospiraceae bacterium]
MKNLLLFLCFALSTHLFAQNTQWFPTGSIWQYSYYSLGGFGTEVIEYAGTETVGGESCAKMQVTTLHNTFGAYHYTYKDEYFFSRNDSVFYWDQTYFRLLYDFTRQPGDTIWLTNSPNTYAVVQATGDTTWQGIPLQYQDLVLVNTIFGSDTFQTPTRVYERLGGSHLILWDIESPLTEIYYVLDCYADDEYPNPDCESPFAPGYKPFPLNLAFWSEDEGSFCNYNGFQYMLKGDTSLPGYDYSKKIFYKPNYTGSDPCPTASAQMLNDPPVLLGAISQDLAGKKVYYTDFAGPGKWYFYPRQLDYFSTFQLGETRLLYDFDLEPAQILDWKPEPRMYVFSDSIQLNDGSLRRRLFFIDSETGEFDSTYYWLEGIGGSHGLFTALIYPSLVDVWSGFRCFREPNNLLLNNVPEIFCDSVPITSSVPNLPSLETQIRLYPNPASAQVQVELPAGALPAQLTVFDPLGRRLKTEALVLPTAPVDLSGVDSPWLLLQIRSRDGRLAEKLLLLDR